MKVKRVLQWVAFAMIVLTFLFGGLQGVKTELNNWINPPATEQGQ